MLRELLQVVEGIDKAPCHANAVVLKVVSCGSFVVHGYALRLKQFALALHTAVNGSHNGCTTTTFTVAQTQVNYACQRCVCGGIIEPLRIPYRGRGRRYGCKAGLISGPQGKQTGQRVASCHHRQVGIEA